MQVQGVFVEGDDHLLRAVERMEPSPFMVRFSLLRPLVM
jgi:hypothetical protein